MLFALCSSLSLLSHHKYNINQSSIHKPSNTHTHSLFYPSHTYIAIVSQTAKNHSHLHTHQQQPRFCPSMCMRVHTVHLKRKPVFYSNNVINSINLIKHKLCCKICIFLFCANIYTHCGFLFLSFLFGVK